MRGIEGPLLNEGMRQVEGGRQMQVMKKNDKQNKGMKRNESKIKYTKQYTMPKT